jgi:hypothetical protein
LGIAHNLFCPFEMSNELRNALVLLILLIGFILIKNTIGCGMPINFFDSKWIIWSLLLLVVELNDPCCLGRRLAIEMLEGSH